MDTNKKRDRSGSGAFGWAEWWAALVNARAVADLGESDRLVLFEHYLRLTSEALPLLYPTAAAVDDRPQEAWTAARTWEARLDVADRVLEPAHKLGHQVITALLDGQEIPHQLFADRGVVRCIRLRGDDGSVAETVHVSGQLSLLALSLYALVRPGSPFRLRRCLVCHRVFVRIGPKAYCGESCRWKAADAKRDLTTRREQLRQNAKRYRRRKMTQPDRVTPDGKFAGTLTNETKRGLTPNPRPRRKKK